MTSDLSEFISEEGLNQFFLDVRENLDLMESSLLEMEEFPDDVEPRQSMLRALHSIKGAAHMFGYEQVAVFSHLLEDVHIRVQRGDLDMDETLIGNTLKARDILDQLLSGEPDADLFTSLQAYFEGLRPAGEPMPDPVATVRPARPRSEHPVTYRLRFRFHGHQPIFMNATNPLWYLRSLRDLGELRIHCLTDQVPQLAELDIGTCHLIWQGTLITPSSREEILDEFTFIEDDLAELVVESQSMAPPLPTTPAVEPLLARQEGFKILIADDDFNNRMVLRGILLSLGDCDMVVDGGEAVEIFELALTDGKPYRLVLLDIMMPVMDGYAALQEIRTIEKKHGVKPREETVVIMVTALDTPRSVFRAFYAGGCTDYLVKPVTREAVMAKLLQHGLVTHA